MYLQNATIRCSFFKKYFNAMQVIACNGRQVSFFEILLSERKNALVLRILDNQKNKRKDTRIIGVNYIYNKKSNFK